MTEPDSMSMSPDHPIVELDELLYDSFVVRLWHHRGRAAFSRAEVRHVQTGKASTKTDVDLDWMHRAISRFLDEDQSRERHSGD
jgi:hypothetical protein